MTYPIHFQKYLSQVDECLSVKNNPEKAAAIGRVLMAILDEYRKISYKKEYFQGFYLAFFDDIEPSIQTANYESIENEFNYYFDEVIQEKLKELSTKLDRLSIIKKNSEDDNLNEKINELITEIKSEGFMTEINIENYKYQAQDLINEYNYTPVSSTQTNVIVKEQPKSGCLSMILILIIPILIKLLFL